MYMKYIYTSSDTQVYEFALNKAEACWSCSGMDTASDYD